MYNHVPLCSIEFKCNCFEANSYNYSHIFFFVEAEALETCPINAITPTLHPLLTKLTFSCPYLLWLIELIMWIFTPFLFSVVLCSWLPSFTDFDKDGGHHATISHDHLAESPRSLNKTDAVSTYELEADWECLPGCPLCAFIPTIPIVNESKADNVLAATTPNGLDFPAPGKLDAWAQHVFSSEHYDLPIDIPDSVEAYLPTATYLPWEGRPFFATISGFTGCTSVILACDCGIYLVS